MSNSPSTQAKILLALCVVLLLSACGSSGPAGPAPGTPAFNWLKAQDAYKTGNYEKATSLLVDLSKGQHEYAARAQAWAAVLSLGLTNAYSELADKLDDGAKRSPSPGSFRRLTNEYRSRAKATALQFTEVAHMLTADKKEPQPLFVFALPDATFEDPQQYKKFAIGQLVPDAEVESIERDLVKREILRAACRAMNAQTDVAKAKAAFQNGEAKVDCQPFLMMVASGLYQTGELFGPKKLDQPHRLKLIYGEADEALAMVKGNKEAAELTKKIAQSRKKMNL